MKQEQQIEESLKPCPFCGNKNIEVEREGNSRQSCIVACGNCGCIVESNENGFGHDWNIRTPAQDQGVKTPEPAPRIDGWDQADHWFGKEVKTLEECQSDFWNFGYADYDLTSDDPDNPEFDNLDLEVVYTIFKAGWEAALLYANQFKTNQNEPARLKN